ncbi:Muscle calcium channel subunit alpha-1 (MDL-alpha-1) [Durusdinium trenchii]|uniref:Muscle calcium channel subunit alpha-1 (MDL-alpha-1) n=1 Tax=Durusdinium trenchii TaxID=1381693 RepID=A0ABP0JZB8_9DINO
MKASPSRHGYQKVPQHDPHISEVETDCDSLWHTERFNMSPENGISVDLLKIEKDDEDDDLISAVDKKSMFYFVESWWFHLLAALVICCNTVSIVLEADSKLSEKLLAKLFWVDQCSLIFYVLELFCRACFWKKRLLCGTRSLAMWSLIDIIVVGAGVLDQWLFRYLAPYLPMSAESAQNILGIIRLMRLVRVIKLLALMLDWDLSWTEGAGFQSFIGGVIAVNALLMGCETDIDWGGWLVFENFLLCIYVFELVVRLKRLGREFFSCDSPDIVWNLLDLAIVVSSAGDSWLVPLINVVRKSFQGPVQDHATSTKAHGVNVGQLMMLMRLLRLLRILRLAKLVKSVRPLYILVVSVTAAVQGVVWVLVLTVVTLYAMGILTTRLIGHKMIFNADQDRAGGNGGPGEQWGLDVDEALISPFKTVPDSMFTLFRVMSGAQSDEESEALDRIMSNIPTFKFAFVFFMVTSSWTLLSILTAVVSENMISTTAVQETEIQLMSEEEDRKGHIEDLKELFQEINTTGDGIVRERDLVRFLQNTSNAQQTAKMCRVPVRHVQEVMKTLAINSDVIRMEEFVECLLDVGNPVTEKSTMRLEALHLETRSHSVRHSQVLEENLETMKQVVEDLHFERQDQINQLEKTLAMQGQVIGRLQSSVEGLHQKVDHFFQLLAPRQESR